MLPNEIEFPCTMENLKAEQIVFEKLAQMPRLGGRNVQRGPAAPGPGLRPNPPLSEGLAQLAPVTSPAGAAAQRCFTWLRPGAREAAPGGGGATSSRVKPLLKAWDDHFNV